MKKLLLPALFLLPLACEQSTLVFDPVNNKAATASTAATQGTLTLNVTYPATDTPHLGQVFTALLYQNGVLKAGIPDTGAGTTSGTGVASVQLLSPNLISNCLDGTAAILPNGSYDLYFAIHSATDTIVPVNAGGCAANGFFQYSSISSTYLTGRGSVTINGDSVFNLTNTNTFKGLKHTFVVAAGAGLNGRPFRCYLVDPNVTAITATTQAIAIYNGTITDNVTGDGCTTGDGVTTTVVGGACAPTGAAKTYLTPPGSYKFFCYIDTNGGGFFDPVDRVASGTATVSGANTTFLNSGAFSP